ncbi:MAG: 3-oxoacyl-ACP reductase FabG [Clostridia bacterium]|nr:3-oxoacyl-ACP reductase FabG [Clostridia bacterium]
MIYTKGRLAAVTGASRGIGAATARTLAAAGCEVALICEKNLDMAAALSAELSAAYGVNTAAFAADLSDERCADALFEHIRAHFGRLPDILVNNAGIAHANVLVNETAQDFDRIFAVNVRTAFLCCRAVYDSMVANRWGRIINVSSMWGVVGASCEVLYSASKAAVIGLTKGLALELAPSGVTVNAVAPGVIRTDMLGCYDEETLCALASDTPVGRLGTPEDVAAVIAFLASEDAGFVTGQVIGANGGFVT